LKIKDNLRLLVEETMGGEGECGTSCEHGYVVWIYVDSLMQEDYSKIASRVGGLFGTTV